MKIVGTILVLSCIVNLIQSESGGDSESEVMGDSGWWSTRIAKINRKGREQIGLASRDNQRRGDGTRQQQREEEEEAASKGEQKTAMPNSRRRSRPFESVSPSNGETRFRDRFESQREKYREEMETPRDFVSRIPPEPSPILQPPLPTRPFPPVYRINIFAENATTSDSNDESSLNEGKSGGGSSALERARIREITTANSTNDQADEESEASRADNDESLKSFRDDDVKNRWTSYDAEDPYENRTKPRSRNLPEDGRKVLDSFYIDENTRNGETVSFGTFRGNERYHRDFLDDEHLTRKRNFPRSERYEERSRHFKFTADTSAEFGSVPGVPGRDYPIHQEHTHHRLRNTVDRFPCPRTPKNHVYLPDRASRCQIFYVCYGSKTGVPMVCPNGTLFNEPLQVCDWWYNVSC